MKTNQLFERLWGHGRTLRRVGMVLAMCLTLCGNAWGANGDVLFSQDFSSATAVAYTESTARAYTSSNYNICGTTAASQFTTITCNSKGSAGIGINSASGGNSKSYSDKFGVYANNTSFYWSICKTSNFAATAPTAIKVEFNAAFAHVSSGSNIGVQIAVGSSFSSGLTNSCPALSNCVAGFAWPSNSTLRIAKYAASNGNTAINGSSSTLTGGTSYKYTWVINNTASTLTYTGPDNKSTTVAAGCWDLWVGTTRNLAGVTKATTGMSGTTIQNLYIGSPFGKKHEFILDDITVTDLTPSSGFTLTNAVSPAGYGTVSPSSVTSIPSGTATSSSTNTYTVNGTTVTATPAASTSAWTYAFSSWSGLPATVTAAATVTAIFSRTGNSYTITLDKDGGSGGTATVSATYGSAMPSAGAAPTQAGYTFLGYYASQGASGTQYYDATPESATNSDFTSATTIYAGWKVNAPTITFSNDLSNIVTITGTAGASIYYTTDGSTPSESSTLYSAPFTINADKTIKAIAIKAGAQNSAVASLPCTYSAPPTWYTLSYDANGGSGSMPSHDFTSGTTVYAGQNTSFTPPSGKIFKCWNTAPNGGGTSYSEGASFTLSGNTTLYAQWITASTGSTYCINMYNLSVSDQMKYFTYSGSSDIQILDLEVPSYNTGDNNFWVGKNGSWYNDGLGNSNAKSANEKLEDLCLKGNREVKLGTSAQNVLARFFVYDNSSYNNLYIEFLPKQYSLIWGSGGDWSPVKLYPSGCENEWTSEVVTLTSDQISSYNYYVGVLKADNGVAYWYKSNTLSVGSMGTFNKRTDTWGGNVSTLSAGDKGFFRMWSDATGYDNWRCHFVPVYTLSYNANSGSGAPSAVYVASEGDESHRTVYVSTTEPTRTGYSFGGWATSATGNVVYSDKQNVKNLSATSGAVVNVYAKWSDASNAELCGNGCYVQR